MPGTSALLEIDLATAPAFVEAMRRAIDSATDRSVFIDCSAITFMDSSAFHALVDANAYASRHDHVLVIRGLAESCKRLLRICDIATVITIEA